MTITEPELDTKYADWFRGKRNTAQAKREILQHFQRNPMTDTNGRNRMSVSSAGKLFGIGTDNQAPRKSDVILPPAKLR